jgi:hypothetical protein
MKLTTDIWLWIQAFVCISVFSFLYKDNPVFAIAQNFYVGAAASHGAVLAFQNFKSLAWMPLTTQGKTVIIIPLLLGVMMLTRFSKKYAYISRISLAVPIGIGSGVALKAIPAAQVLSQIRATVTNLSTIDNIIILIGVMATISFFLFTAPQNPVTKGGYNLGLCFMCVTFGVTFASGILSYISIFYGPANAILESWLGLYGR